MAEIDMTFTGMLSEDCRSIVIDNAQGILRVLYTAKGIPLEINIKKFHKLRTAAQNRYIWGLVIPTIRTWQIETTGECNSKDGLYAFLRISIVGQEVIIEEISGVDCPIIKGKRFSEMTTVEFNEAIDKIILHYAELGLTIPLPVPGSNNTLSDFVNIKDE
jgi:hypothetical protein